MNWTNIVLSFVGKFFVNMFLAAVLHCYRQQIDKKLPTKIGCDSQKKIPIESNVNTKNKSS